MKIYRLANIEYPVAGPYVSGLEVRNNVPNQSSIDASLTNYEILNGIREIPLSEFDLTGKHYSAQGSQHIRNLAEEIKQNGWIEPLIVVVDQEGPYILEGGHRSEALYLLGAKSLPAMVVVDKESDENLQNS